MLSGVTLEGIILFFFVSDDFFTSFSLSYPDGRKIIFIIPFIFWGLEVMTIHIANKFLKINIFITYETNFVTLINLPILILGSLTFFILNNFIVFNYNQ